MKARSKKTILKNKITKEKKDMNKNKKAQVSIEMIIILSVLILGAVILASLLLGFFNKSVDTNVDIDAQTGNTVNSFINDLVNYNDSNNDDTPTPTPLFYNLTLTPNNPSFGSAQTSGSYQAGSLVTVIATPNAGYSFNNWTVTSTGVVASSSASYSFTMPSNNLALTANFSAVAPTTYTLSLVENSNEPNATLLGSGNYSTGSTVSISINNTGPINFINWTDGSGNIISSNQSFNYTMPSANTTLTANFSAVAPTTYTLSLVENPNEPNATLLGSGNYSTGSTVSISINNTGPINFINWTNQSGTIVSTESSFNYTMPSNNTTLNANFSTVVEFCPESISYNGDTYKLLQIGDQCWFVENLKTTKYKDGSNILTALDSGVWSKTTSGAYDVYDYTNSYVNDIDSSAKMISAYGLLYNWYAVDDSRGLCPDHFRVATDADFEGLKYFVNFTTKENLPARHLKTDRTEIGEPIACSPTNVHPRFLFPFNSSQCGLDTFGFSAIPSGYLNSRKESDLLGIASYFWIDGHNSPNYADHYSTTYYRTDLTNWGLIEKNIGLSVRCVKGGNLPTTYDLNYTLDVLKNNDLLGSVTGSGNVIAGTNVTVTANPISGSSFLNWTNSQNEVLSTSSSYTFKMPYRYYTIKANFSSIPSYPIEINLNDPTSNQQFPPYYTHPTDGAGIRLMASISGSSASNSEFYKVWEYTRNMVNRPTWVSFNSGNTGNSSSAYALYIPTQTGTYYFRLKYTDDYYPGSTFYSNVVQVNVVLLP